MTDTENQTTEIDIDDIGTILKSSRLKSKMTLEEISGELCIRKIYLTAIEEGDYETLPPIPYGVGYVRTYARYLGLNPERAVQLYKAAAINEEPKEVEEETVSEPEVNKGNLWHVVIGVIVLAVIYGGWSLYSADMEPATEDVAVTEEKLIAEEAVEEETSNTTDSATEVTEKSVAEEKTDTTKEETKPAEEKPAAADEKFVAAPDKVIFKFSGDSWVELKNKKRVFFQGVFHNGDVKEIAYEPNLFVSIGRPKNLTMYIKGNKKQIFSTKHKMNIPLDSIK